MTQTNDDQPDQESPHDPPGVDRIERLPSPCDQLELYKAEDRRSGVARPCRLWVVSGDESARRLCAMRRERLRGSALSHLALPYESWSTPDGDAYLETATYGLDTHGDESLRLPAALRGGLPELARESLVALDGLHRADLRHGAIGTECLRSIDDARRPTDRPRYVLTDALLAPLLEPRSAPQTDIESESRRHDLRR
ncbi:MAG: hypothetical protein QM811_08020 [Pirellulales bacterium]